MLRAWRYHNETMICVEVKYAHCTWSQVLEIENNFIPDISGPYINQQFKEFYEILLKPLY